MENDEFDSLLFAAITDAKRWADEEFG